MPIVDTNFSQTLSIMQGQTAQTWYGFTMAENGTALENDSQAPAGLPSSGESPSPYELTYATNAPTGWATQAGEDTSTYLTGSGPAGTPQGSSGVTYGPNSGQEAVQGAPGGSAQAWQSWEQSDGITVTATPASYSGPAATAVATAVTLTATGTTSYATAPFTYSAYAPSTLPTGFSLDSSTGVISLADTTVAGTYELTFVVGDSYAGGEGAHHGAQITVVFTLT